MSIRSTTLLALFALSSFATADVLIVAPAGGPTALQDAVDLAASGDVLLVKPGTYGGANILGKGLSIIADGAPVPLIAGTINVTGLPASDAFVLHGFRVNSKLAPGHDEAFFARNCEGSLLIENCTFISDNGIPGMEGNLFPGRSGVRLVNVASSTWNRCTAIGGQGAHLSVEEIDYGVGRGGDGFEFGGGEHSLFNCIGVGGSGGTVFDTEDIDGGHGGSGATFGSFGFASGCTLSGGFGGDGECSFVFCATAGNGGNGIGTLSLSEVWTLGNTYTPGIAGNYPSPGWDGKDVSAVVGSTHLDLPGLSKGLELTTPVRVFDTGQMKVSGETGELALLFFSLNSDLTPNLALNGVFAPALPLKFINLGLLPEGGEKTLNFTVQPIGGLESVSIYMQAVMFDGGTSFVSGASNLTIVDPSF